MLPLNHLDVPLKSLFAYLNKTYHQDFSPLSRHIRIHCTRLHIHSHQHNYIWGGWVGGI